LNSLRHVLTLIALLFGFYLPETATAWGVDGHRLIGDLAQQQLNPKARAEIERLLSLEPGATLGSIANWADEHRTATDAPWHYVNLPRHGGCRFEAARDCAQGQCVVAAIDRQTAILSARGTDADRLKALKYAVHFVADIHQPLHAGFADDRGGNTVQLQAYGRGTNLHAVWDTALVVNWPGGLDRLTRDLEAIIRGPVAVAARGADPARWAEESCRIVEEDWFYPDRRKLDSDYEERAQRIVRARLILASQRLADLLNRVLD
jgi:hypothetical protein